MEITSIPSVPAPAARTGELTKDQLAERRAVVKAVGTLNRAQAYGPNRELTFSFDREAHRTVVRVVDSGDGQVLLQIPAEEVLRLARAAAAGH